MATTPDQVQAELTAAYAAFEQRCTDAVRAHNPQLLLDNRTVMHSILPRAFCTEFFNARITELNRETVTQEQTSRILAYLAAGFASTVEVVRSVKPIG